MIRALLAGAAAVTMLATAPLAGMQTPASSSQASTFKARADMVRVDVLVTLDDKPVAGLTRDDFEVYDNGVRQQIDLAAAADDSVSVTLGFDASGSLTAQRLNELRGAGDALLDSLTDRDRAALVGFTHVVDLRTPLTGNLAVLRRAIAATTPDGDTSLLDATYASLVVGASSARSLAIVFSDGVDTASWLTPDIVLDCAKRANVVVYGVTVGKSQSAFLRDLTSATGGELMSADSTATLGPAFVRILNEFRQRYLLSYQVHGTLAPGWHQIDVRVHRRGVKTRARPGYVSGPGGPAGHQ